jgi:hypothetical protein
MTIKAIETLYRGYRFRSRLEARWAVAFDHMGLRWEYEPEGFELSDGTRYLPDFLLHIDGKKVWVEIKPYNGDVSKFERFIREINDGSIGTVLHEIPEECGPGYLSDYYENDEPHIWGATENGERGWLDNFYKFCRCTKCGKMGFEYMGRSERISCSCYSSDKVYNDDDPKILSAFAAARSARFEHGETPNPPIKSTLSFSELAKLSEKEPVFIHRDNAEWVETHRRLWEKLKAEGKNPSYWYKTVDGFFERRA